MIPVLTYGKPSASRQAARQRALPGLPAAPSIATTLSRRSRRILDGRAEPSDGLDEPGERYVGRLHAFDLARSLAPRAPRPRTPSRADGRLGCRRSPPRRPPPGTTRSSPSTPACPPSARIPSATPVSRSVSLTRSSAAPGEPRLPTSSAARTARMGTSSITSGSSDASITVPRRSAPGATHSSPTGSPSSWPDGARLGPYPHPFHHLEEVQPARVQAHPARRSAPSPSARPPPPGTPRTRRRPARCR